MTFGIDAGADGVEHVAAGQVDGGGGPPRQVDAGLVGGDDRRRRLAARCRATGKCGFQLLRRHLDAGLHQRDLLPDDHVVIDVAQLHPDRSRC